MDKNLDGIKSFKSFSSLSPEAQEALLEAENRLAQTMEKRIVLTELMRLSMELDKIDVSILKMKLLSFQRQDLAARIEKAKEMIASGEAMIEYDEQGSHTFNF